MICLASHWSGACTNQPMGKQVMTQIGGSWNPLDDASAIAESLAPLFQHAASPPTAVTSARQGCISTPFPHSFFVHKRLSTPARIPVCKPKRLTATDRLPILSVLPLAPTAIPLLGCQSANRLPPRPLARNFPNNPEYQRNSNGVQAFDMLRQECRVHLRYVLILRLCLLRSLRSTVSYISKSL